MLPGGKRIRLLTQHVMSHVHANCRVRDLPTATMIISNFARWPPFELTPLLLSSCWVYVEPSTINGGATGEAGFTSHLGCQVAGHCVDAKAAHIQQRLSIGIRSVEHYTTRHKTTQPTRVNSEKHWGTKNTEAAAAVSNTNNARVKVLIAATHSASATMQLKQNSAW